MKIFKIAQDNYYTKEIAKNTKDPEILKKILERGNDDWISRWAALNKNCPPEVLTEVLKRGKNDYVSSYAALNKNCPPEVLAEVLKRGNDDWVSWYAAENENCPPEALAEVLKRGNDDLVSSNAAINLNCPPQIKIEWMRNHGMIGKEDPTKHIIQYDLNEKEEKPDEDLEKLRKLISKRKTVQNNRITSNMKTNWYKVAQNYQFIAQNPSVPSDPNVQLQNLQNAQNALNYFDGIIEKSEQIMAAMRELEDELGIGDIGTRNQFMNIIKQAAMKTSAFNILSQMNFVSSVDNLLDAAQISNVKIIINNNIRSIQSGVAQQSAIQGQMG